MKRLSPAFAAKVCALLLALSFPALGQVPDRRDGKPDNSDYQKMVTRLKAGEKDVDMVRFRAAYLEWVNDECNISDAPDREAMVKAFEAKDHAKAVKLAQKVLDYEYANRGLHLAVANSYKELGNTEKAKFHADLGAALWKALMDSGDGKSAKTAYRVHSIREEYMVMRELGYQVSQQALVQEGGRAFDVLSGKNADGKAVSVYFDINDWWIGSTSSKPCSVKKRQ